MFPIRHWFRVGGSAVAVAATLAFTPLVEAETYLAAADDGEQLLSLADAGSPPAGGAAAAPAEAGPNLGRISLDLGVDFTDKYFFRGIPEENQGLITQPWAEVGFNVFEREDGFLNSIDLFLGTWNSFHTNKTGAADTGPSNWYEADIYAGISTTVFDDFELGFVYTAYTFPNGAADSVQEVGFLLAYDDSGLLGDFALNPWAGLFFEIDDGSSDQRVAELGIEPGFDLLDADEHGFGLSVSVPVTLGLDMGQYYGDQTFGFFDAGVVLSTPLTFIPADYGAWEAAAGVHYIHIGSTAAAAGFPGVTDGSQDFVYGTVGLSLSY